MSVHDHPTRAINRCLHRLPLILDILDELQTEQTHPGDEDLKNGSHQAVSRMVERLQDIKPVQVYATDKDPTTEAHIAASWLLGERPRQLLPSSLYAELSELIKRLIPQSTERLSGQSD